ncbi:hypothetical protein MJO28_007695 [Puccinia striiformis f. sp. tritici]|uniref:Uncharacterized protein n=1 Tax=Puccinia striiformis f. sp. tritici TaxID=168172 RepID=A0ACC0EFB7_9BASI|nr:hypothetical protein Pst134EA_013776 [Puccinia striiformis f. sp. tritici]KAH9465920.1 hypothetical protein Pst134EA_013776 [Puccinia striiformis f. sp. tritici]KAI7952011.1 hypothetical protein MJO28_007695 [Puccinia striiformis f. sp. tritici]
MGLYSFATPRVIAARIKAGRVNKDWAVVDVRGTSIHSGFSIGFVMAPVFSFFALTWFIIFKNACVDSIRGRPDSDYIGGHIPGCHHIPSSSFHEKCPGLINELKDVKCVIFHCALSQQRGPTAAKLYAHRREDKLTSGTLNSILPFGEEAQARGSSQEVIIIEGGFTNWVREFKDDERLVEGYNPAVWSSSY